DVITATKTIDEEEEEEEEVHEEFDWKKQEFKWKNILLLGVWHLAAFGFYIYACIYDFKIQTVYFSVAIGMMSGIGTSAGSHRLWSHRAYKARWPLKLWLLIFQAMTMNGSALSYARDHRTHHKYSDTAGDPKNPTRGLFYSHVGWWLVKKTDAVIDGGKQLDFTDLYNERLVYLQHKYYFPIFIVFGVIMPWLIPIYAWNEDPWMALGFAVILRIVIVLHHLFTVNSLAHFFGYRPYDFRIRPADHRFVNYISFGEGIHNYHHVFPFDYRINEHAQWELFNPPGMFIQLNRLFGLAYDCKTASPSVINGVVKRRGVQPVRDVRKSLSFRIVNAIFDWTIGMLVGAWAAYPLIIFKLFTGRPIG
ncbi:Acyl-CoA desaturase-like protein, partial [Euroglyphus maynei]